MLTVALLVARATALAQTAPSLGDAASFVVLGRTAVVNTGATTIVGNVGVSPSEVMEGAGSLPAGLALAPAGALQGTPAVVGTFAFTVTVTDAAGCTGTTAYVIEIACGAPTVLQPVCPTDVPALSGWGSWLSIAGAACAGLLVMRRT